MDWRMSFIVVSTLAGRSKATLLEADHHGHRVNNETSESTEKTIDDRPDAPGRKRSPGRIHGLLPYKSHEVELGIILVRFCTRV